MQGKERGLKCLKCLKRKKKFHQTIILYPEKRSFKGKGEIKDFTEKEKLMKSVGSRSALQEKLKKNTSNGIKFILF